MTVDERIIGDLIHDLSYRQLALEWTSIDEHWAISCADADGIFAVDCLAAGGFAAGNQYQYCIPLCLPPLPNDWRLPRQSLGISGCWFRGDCWGFRYGGRMELPTYLPAHPLYVSLVLYRHWSARLQTTYL